ncbi:MAG TPA: DUF4147 domain-containing protein [Patescibacteria group bacterium]|uniref:Glycerate kinase n=1 Tax=Candidatus Woesebacteria bacterium RBG_13_46_13 TaxID=1802479 RepID=A0A1F7X3U9_9BACT|nr:MAG: hypothetical protein A2Y68_00200 [Candidatus Woesebacteria bacterium RBG_13_46_13]HJX58989.1 DUF4147 domain-containing protein [Patescibacteria group bacterium]
MKDIFRSKYSKGLKKEALDILKAGLISVTPAVAISGKIHYQNNKLIIEGDRFDLAKGRLFIIGGGKASANMASQLEKKFPKGKIYFGLVNSPNVVKTTKIKIQKVTHPLPSAGAIRGMETILKAATRIDKEDTVICLLSGGGSASMFSPQEGISLGDMRKTVELMTKGGVPTREIQIVRKHLSRIQGGQLAKSFQPARIICITISDLIDPKDVVAGGPTEPDTSTYSDADRILRKHSLYSKIPGSIKRHLKKGVRGEVDETPKPGDPIFKNVHNYILADSTTALSAMAKRAKELGYAVIINKPPVVGKMDFASEKIASIIRALSEDSSRPIAILFNSEISVKVKGTGRGGRNQELVANLTKKLPKEKRFVMAGLGTDGIDFIKGIGGAMVDNEDLERISLMKLKVEKYLQNNDSYVFHSKLGSLIKMKPTGTGVGDVHLYLQK